MWTCAGQGGATRRVSRAQFATPVLGTARCCSRREGAEGQDNGNRSVSVCCLSSTQENAKRGCVRASHVSGHVENEVLLLEWNSDPLAILQTEENKISARKCHRREDAHRVVGWECANSGHVESGPWSLVTWQEFLTRGEGGTAYSLLCTELCGVRNGGTQTSALPGDSLVVAMLDQALAATPSFLPPTRPS